MNCNDANGTFNVFNDLVNDAEFTVYIFLQLVVKPSVDKHILMILLWFCDLCRWMFKPSICYPWQVDGQIYMLYKQLILTSTSNGGKVWIILPKTKSLFVLVVIMAGSTLMVFW